MPRSNRKHEILEALARELENRPGGRVTTAALAQAVGVSEAALYRHFPSKARMFEGLIEFAEESLFKRINQILEEDRSADGRCSRILYLLLAFADRNPGIVRVLLGDAIVGERDRLHNRVEQLFDRIEVQLRQVLRESALRDGDDLPLRVSPETGAGLLTAYVEGRMHQLLRSRYRQQALGNWDADGEALLGLLFGAGPDDSQNLDDDPAEARESS